MRTTDRLAHYKAGADIFYGKVSPKYDDAWMIEQRYRDAITGWRRNRAQVIR